MHSFFKYSIKHHYFQYKWYNQELLRLLGSAPFGGCDAAEFLEAVQQIRPNDAASWESTFLRLAETAEGLAREAEANGLVESARGAYLRASNYYRCAQFLFMAAPESQQARMLQVYERSVAAFDSATRLFEHPVVRVDIPYRHHHHHDATTITLLPGRLYLPAPAQRLLGRKTPLVVCIGGADTTQEELYFMHVSEGPRLGFAVLTFDGPGQGHVLRRDKIAMRPDWEEVVPGVLDWAADYARENPAAELDLDAMVLVGESLGGFLALRGAVDARVKAVVAIDAFYDMWDLAVARMPGWMMRLWERQLVIRDSFINWSARAHGRVDVVTRYDWGLATRLFGLPSGADALRNMKTYSFKGGDYLARIRCPVLLSGAAADKGSFAPLAATEALHVGLQHLAEDDKELWVARTYAAGGGQGKIGAWSLLHYRTYRFLDQKLEISREEAAATKMS